jgi:hypothetical protein
LQTRSNCCFCSPATPLLAATTIDLRRGGEPALPHALAAVYTGVSVAWGQRIVSWADVRFAHRFAGGPPPERPPRTGRRHAARQRREWLRHLTAWATGTTLLGIGVLVAGDLDRAWALLNVAALWTLVLAINFVISFSYTLRPRLPEEKRLQNGNSNTALARARARVTSSTRSCGSSRIRPAE